MVHRGRKCITRRCCRRYRGWDGLRFAPAAPKLIVRRFLPFWCSSFSRLLFAACWFCQSGSARVASGGQLPGFTCPAQPLSRFLRSTGNFSQKRNLWGLGSSRLLGSFRGRAPVAASCRSLTLPLSRQIFLTLRSTPDAMKQPSFPQPSARGAG